MQALEQKYGMRYDEFDTYLHKRSQLLVSGTLNDDERRILGQAVMQEDDDWLDWKSSRELLESWLGIGSVPQP